jgi:antirestriction protein ArdC
MSQGLKRSAKTRRRRSPSSKSSAPATRAEAARPSIYDEVTQRIVGELEAGRVPWVQPWGATGGADVALPRNAASRRAYSGINVLILWGAVIAHHYPTQDWITFYQAQSLGGSVRKGERGQTIVYADRFTPEDEAARATKGDYEPRTVPFLKRFTVFNVAQCDGLSGIVSDPVPLADCEVVPVGEDLIQASGVEYRIGGAEAFYAPIFDFVQVPPQPAFFQQVDYYRTAFHELTHATGHASRVGRDLSHRFGTAAYAREELVAELGAAFLCASLGIVPTVRHADYLGSWLAVLKDDNRAIFRAASQASKAADWLLGRLQAHADAEAAA